MARLADLAVWREREAFEEKQNRALVLLRKKDAKIRELGEAVAVAVAKRRSSISSRQRAAAVDERAAPAEAGGVRPGGAGGGGSGGGGRGGEGRRTRRTRENGDTAASAAVVESLEECVEEQAEQIEALLQEVKEWGSDVGRSKLRTGWVGISTYSIVSRSSVKLVPFFEPQTVEVCAARGGGETVANVVLQ